MDDKTKERLKSALGLMLIKLVSDNKYDINEGLDGIIAYIENEVTNSG